MRASRGSLILGTATFFAGRGGRQQTATKRDRSLALRSLAEADTFRPRRGSSLAMSMARVLKAGVVGAGVFGGYHANKYASLPDVTLAGILDADAARGAALAEKLSTP